VVIEGVARDRRSTGRLDLPVREQITEVWLSVVCDCKVPIVVWAAIRTGCLADLVDRFLSHGGGEMRLPGLVDDSGCRVQWVIFYMEK
jgi:hypothetical protein